MVKAHGPAWWFVLNTGEAVALRGGGRNMSQLRAQEEVRRGFHDCEAEIKRESCWWRCCWCFCTLRALAGLCLALATCQEGGPFIP